MKGKKVLGSILTGVGCVILLIGLAALLLPMTNNPQMMLVLSSFQTPSDNWLIQLMNNSMNFAMEHCYPMMLIGAAVMLAGILLILSLRGDEQMQAAARQRNAFAPPAATPNATPYRKPAVQPMPAARRSQDNPFARYAAAQGQTSPVVKAAPPVTKPVPRPVAPEIANSSSDIESIWEQLQQPEEPEALFIQPIQLEDDEAYRRPESDPKEPKATAQAWELPLPNHTTSWDEPEDTKPAPETSPEPIPEPIPEPHAEVPVETVQEPSAPAEPEAQRTLIRSTFHKATSDRPSQPMVAAPPASPDVSPDPPQPATSRIKSTMGRKR